LERRRWICKVKDVVEGIDMRMEEIKKRFKGEWVLIEYSQLDDHLAVLEGEVLVHSLDKDVIYREQLRYKGKQLAIEYLGEIPEDWAVML